MPRAVNGLYTLPNTVNPVLAGTTITANWANTTLADMAQAMTDSLDRQGRGSMAAPLKLAAGTVALPGLAFANEASTGLYRPGAGQVAVTVLGTEVMQIRGTQILIGVAIVSTQEITATRFNGPLTGNATSANRLTLHNVSSQNLNTITLPGHYDGGDLISAPLGSNGWWYIEVIRHAGFIPGTQEWVMQRATGLSGAHQGRVFVRNGIAPASWTPWSEQTSAASVDPSALPTAVLGSGTANATTFLRGDRTYQSINAAVASALNAPGSAPIFACRAWVNFNGVGTVAIRASGNVSSITDNGVGDYTVNFTTAMVSADYSAYAAGPSGTNGTNLTITAIISTTATNCRILHTPTGTGAGGNVDTALVCVAVFQ